MNITKGILLLAAFVTGFLLGIGIKLYYESTTFKPYEWDRSPIIANCYGPDFSELQITRAIHYWTVRGHNIAFYEHSPPKSICESEDMVHGFIVLRKAKWFELGPETLASTKRLTSTTIIKSATITYRPGSQNLDLLNEHELGHALGYAHLEEEGHIMHPLYFKMGEGFWIP